jgi:putative FmdB family regulatory protein
MPAYDYRCAYCGPFTLTRSIREDTAHGTCPDCAEPATRVFTVPVLLDRTSPVRRALAGAEASASEPRISSRPAAAEPARPARLPGKLAGLPRP